MLYTTNELSRIKSAEQTMIYTTAEIKSSFHVNDSDILNNYRAKK